jgi:Ca-activated chloride channel family protein
MGGGALDEMKRAAQAYVARQDFQYMKIAVVNFGSESQLAAPLSNDAPAISNAIQKLQTNGSTRMDLGLEQGFNQISSATEQRNILLFTDGMPDDNGVFGSLFSPGEPTMKAATQIRNSGVRLLAIATGSADREYLAKLTGDRNLVFSASQGNFGEAFKQAEQIITPPPQTAQLVESAPAENADFQSSLLRIAIWTGILGLGLTLPLLLAQKKYSKRPPALEDAVGAAGGVLIGLLAGIGAQSFFALASGEAAAAGGRIVAWALWGGALGWGLSAFVPNLRADRAAPAGAVGGVLGALGFLAAANVFGDLAGRLAGAAILGFCIGAMIVLAEVAFRRAWLRVSYGPGDMYDVNLGVRPLGVGSDPAKARVLARETMPVAALYSLTEMGRVVIEEPESKNRFEVPVGDERKYGNVTITVCGEVSEIQNADGPPLAPLASPGAEYSQQQTAVTVNGWQLWHPHAPLQIGAQGQWTIGRGSENDVVIGDGTVSSRHAFLEAKPGVLLITDVGSSNGTFINGARLQPHASAPLQPGDRLLLGQSEFVVGVL